MYHDDWPKLLKRLVHVLPNGPLLDYRQVFGEPRTESPERPWDARGSAALASSALCHHSPEMSATKMSAPSLNRICRPPISRRSTLLEPPPITPLSDIVIAEKPMSSIRGSADIPIRICTADLPHVLPDFDDRLDLRGHCHTPGFMDINAV